MRILESSEDYLEAMLMMQEKHGFIRSIDIAAELGVTKPSVSYATKRLRENGYITMDKDGLITLTPAGMEIASRVYDRHKTVAHQGNLKISNHIHNTQGHQLGKKYISRLQVTDFQSAIRACKEKQQYKINGNNQ